MSNLEKFAKNTTSQNTKNQNRFSNGNNLYRDKQSYHIELNGWEKFMWFILGMFGAFSWIILIILFLGGNVGQKIKYWIFGLLTSIVLVILFLVIMASSI